MTRPTKSEQSAASEGELASQAQWETRSTHRVLEAHRDQILERSRQIVEAAYELLAEGGLEGLTIRAVLKKTGLSRRAFYERFADKDDLVVAVFEQTIRLAATYFSHEIREISDPLERLKLIITSVTLGNNSSDRADREHSDRRGAAMSREHLRLAESRPDDLQTALRPLLALIAQQLSDGMQAGLVRPGDPQRLAALVYNLLSTTVHTELLGQKSARADRGRRTQLAEEIWEFCRRAVAAGAQ